MGSRSFLSDILRRVSFGQLRKDYDDSTLADACHSLLNERSEAAGLVVAREILERFENESIEAKSSFFTDVTREFGVDESAIKNVISQWQSGEPDAARSLHYVSEPKSLELLRVLNRVPGATAKLVRMRGDLLPLAKDNPEIAVLDKDFQHLFTSWFNRGFLELRRIDWSTPASILEKIIAYEAVHEISGWDDLRERVAAPDRRLFAFFHPAMPDEPLIFVEVALMSRVPGAITEIIDPGRDTLEPDTTKAAVFYSISNCQKGLRGISFGNFLIKQVAKELTEELPSLEIFVTLSPIPSLRRHAGKSAAENDASKDNGSLLDEIPAGETARKLAASYLLNMKAESGRALDPVAHFHLSNGAELYDVHADADRSETGMLNSWGVMVNYRYDPAATEINHRAYVSEGKVATSANVKALARK
ncbi:MAG: malonyl-CoA decarboxylase [Gammaproteobacteria bacterium]